MPPKSSKQKRVMEAAKHNPKFAKKIGISKEDAMKVLGEDESHDKKKSKKGK